MDLGAYDLTTFQACRRRFLLEQSWRVLKWRSKSLFDSCLRQAIFGLSNAQDVEAATSEARTRFMEQAANPGLEILTGDPWLIASDLCATLSTVLSAVARQPLLTVARPAPQVLSTDGLTWLPSSWQDESGTLHRWITCDSWDADELARAVHGWYVFGDMVAYDAPLTLHVVEIGQMRKGRRASPWCRAYRHPVIAGRYKFQRSDGKGGHRPLNGAEWRPVYLADLTNTDPAAWVDLMDADGVTPTLLHSLSISQPSESVRQETLRQLRTEARRIADLVAATTGGPEAGMALPMARGACDAGHVPCPWQAQCYTPEPQPVGTTGLYQIRTRRAASSSAGSVLVSSIAPAT